MFTFHFYCTALPFYAFIPRKYVYSNKVFSKEDIVLIKNLHLLYSYNSLTNYCLHVQKNWTKGAQKSLSFILKQIYFDCMSERLVVILHAQILQSSVVICFRLNKNNSDEYIKNFPNNSPVKNFENWSTVAEIITKKVLFNFEMRCILDKPHVCNC